MYKPFLFFIHISHLQASRTPRKAATFGKRSNSMRRNPKAEVSKQGWLYKQVKPFLSTFLIKELH